MKEPRVEKKVFEALNYYDFPGNVRELQHMVERALILCEGNALSLRHFDHLQIKLKRKHTLEAVSQLAIPLDTLEKESIEVSLRNSGYNKSKTARVLNISRQALDRRIEKYKIKMPD
jgi:transcriptional regulator with PAS, ATPase and Fis domain